MSGHQPQPARGALLRALAAGATPEALARAFDLGLEPLAPAEGAAAVDGAEAQVAPSLGPPDGGAGWPSLAPPTSFWRVVGFEATPQPPGGEAAPQAVTTAADAGAGADPLRLPPTPPCGPLAPLLDGLRAACGGRGVGHRIDEDAAIDVIASGAPLRRLPTRPRPRWPARLEVWLDISPRLATLAADQRRVLVALAEALGPGAVALRRFDGPPERPPVDAAGAASVVLLLGDLGVGGGSDEAERWADVGAALRRAGRRGVATCALRPNALPTGLQRSWAAVPWVDGPSLVAPSAASPGPRRLLAACAAAGLAQPGLIRALRLALGPGLSLADELALASAPEVEGLDDCGLMVRLEAKDGLLRAFAEEPAALQAEVWGLIAAWHEHTPPELRAGEALAWSCAGLSIDAPALNEARAFVRRVIGTLRDGGGEGSPRSWAGWARDLAAAQPRAAGEDAALLRELQVQAERVLADGAAHPQPTRWAIRQVGLQLVLQPEPEVVHPDVPAEAHRPGSPVGWLLAKQTLVVVRDGRRGTPEPLVEGLPVPIDGAETLSLDTGVETLTLGLVRRADDGGWERMGRDRYGLWAEIDVKGAEAKATQRFRWVAPGRFTMGSPDDEAGRMSHENRQHEVILSHGYWMADTPVTQALYLAVMGVNPSFFTEPADLRRPVERVSWIAAGAFTRQLQRLTQAEGGQADELGFRLPTEAEWERACRADSTGPTYAPKGKALADIAWLREHAGGTTQAVARLLPNAWGLYDMLGNVWEWCTDAVDFNQPVPGGPRVDPVRIGGLQRLERGGSWEFAPQYSRCSSSFADQVGPPSRTLGLRLSRGRAHQLPVDSDQ
jgi:formylglycine-generating enzyme required for sulfatase activity